MVRIPLLFSRLMLTNWTDVQEQVDAGKTTPDLTFLFVILACIIVAGLTVYILVRIMLHAKHEREVLERGLRSAIPHIKALDNNLPGRTLNSLYDDENGSKKN